MARTNNTGNLRDGAWLYGLAILFALLLPAHGLRAEPATVAVEQSQPVEVAGALQRLPDPGCRLKWQDVRAAPDTATQSVESAGMFGPPGLVCLWTRVQLDLRSDPVREQRRLEFEALRVGEVELFVIEPGGRVLRTYRGGANWPGTATDRKFSVSLAGLESFQPLLIARFRSEIPPHIGFTLITGEQAKDRELQLQRILAPMYGCIVLATVLLALLWVRVRDPLFLHGGAMLAVGLLVVQLQLGDDRVYWPPLLLEPPLPALLYQTGIGGFVAFALAFTAQVLEMHRRAPMLNRVMNWTAVVAAPLFPLAVWLAPASGIPMLLGVEVYSAVLLLYATVVALRARAPMAAYFMVFASPVIGVALYKLAAATGMLPFNAGQPYATTVALAAIAFGLSAGLADAFRRRLELQVVQRTRALADVNVELRELDASKNRILGVVAHDVRSPLASIRGAAQALLSDHLPAEFRDEYLRMMRDASDVALALLEDLLDVAAIERGTLRLNPEPTDIVQVIQSRVRLFHVQAERKRISLRLDLEPCPLIRIDGLRLGQALDNLLGNGLKFSEAGETLSVVLRTDPEWVRVTVVDQGVGIAPEDLERIFAPFERAENETSSRERSTGLGLAIVKRLIEAQGGRVVAESTLGVGSRFALLVPRIEAEAPAED